MQCQDTGSMEVIHIPKETIELAQELQPVIDLIREKGSGEGSILMKITGGKINIADFTGRWFFGRLKRQK